MDSIFFDKEALCKPCHDIIAVSSEKSYEELSGKAALLPRGWYELAMLSAEDRIEFTHLFWLSKLPLTMEQEEKLRSFFASLSSIELFLVQHNKKSAYTPLMLYQKKNHDAFMGSVPALPQKVDLLAAQFSHLPLPEDYLSFFSIHDGFSADHDAGVIPLSDFASTYQRFLERNVDLTMLIPFCELDSVHRYQLFYRAHSPSGQMSSLFFDEIEQEAGAVYENFLEWLLDYVHS